MTIQTSDNKAGITKSNMKAYLTKDTRLGNEFKKIFEPNRLVIKNKEAFYKPEGLEDKIKKWKSQIGDATIVKVPIDTRKEKFKSSTKLFAFEIGMSNDALKSFNEYWLEKNKSGTKLKFEKLR